MAMTTGDINSITFIFIIASIGLGFGGFSLYQVLSLDIVRANKRKEDQESGIDDPDIQLIDTKKVTEKNTEDLVSVSQKIRDGSDVFLRQEFVYIFMFVMIFATIIALGCEPEQGVFYTTVAFIIGACTSVLCGFIGMKVATEANYRTTYETSKGLGYGFRIAYYGGCVLGFSLVSLSIIILTITILVFKAIKITPNSKLADYIILYECIAGYGLGGSTVALFCRVGGGIYTKAADVGADLVSKLEEDLDEDDPHNPACIADNVGDNVGDIAGMGSDLFGSLAESLSAALLVGATSPELIATGTIYYPIVITAAGVGISFIVVIFAFIFATRIKTYNQLEMTIRLQIIISTVLMIIPIVLISLYYLPKTFDIGEQGSVLYKKQVSNSLMMVCPLSGLISGMIIGVMTEYFTSMNYGPVKGLVNSCKQGAAINIILGLALGYLSNIVPTVLIALTVFFSFYIAGMYGIALAAIGMLGNLAICLAIDGYGPVSDNAGGLATMCNLPEHVREETDKLDTAGNTTAAIGKGFAIGSACLVAIALFGAFVTKVHLKVADIMTPLMFTGLIIGAMIPFLFSALTMTAVGEAADAMIKVIREDFDKQRRFPELNIQPDSNKCVEVATTHALSHMILPGILVILTPIVFGVLFGPRSVVGLLTGIIISGIQLAISMSNSGGAWDNAKKSIKNNGLPVTGLELRKIENKKRSELLAEINAEISLGGTDDRLKELREQKAQHEERIEALKTEIKEISADENHEEHTKEYFIVEKPKLNQNEDEQNRTYISGEFYVDAFKNAHASSVIGDTVGDPLKDTSGPSLNILIKLSSIISVIFGGVFLKTSLLSK